MDYVCQANYVVSHTGCHVEPMYKSSSTRGEIQLAKEEDIVEKVFFLKGNSANPCLVHCLTSMECG